MVKAEFLIPMKGGKLHPSYAGVLDAATEAGLTSLRVELLQYPSAENGGMAIAQATAEFADGRVFVEIGDASPASTSPQMAAAACRLAATRAKGRALRDALNLGVALAEEMGEEGPLPERAPVPTPANGRPATVTIHGRSAAADSCEGCGAALREAQALFSQRHFAGRSLCLECRPAAAGRKVSGRR